MDTHNEAMAFCDKADGLLRQAKAAYLRAAEKEAEALTLVDPVAAQRTYSIIARSLASIYLSGRMWAKAIETIDTHRPKCEAWVQAEMDEIHLQARQEEAHEVMVGRKR